MKIYFQEFLREILTNQELCAWKYLEEFLSINDYEGFREVRRLREKESAPKSLKTYTNIQGKAKLTIQCQNTKILNNFDTFFINRYEESLKELKQTSNMIYLKSFELSNSIQAFGESLESLSDLFSEWGFDNKIQFYNDLKCVSKAYEDSVLQQAETLCNELDLTLNFHQLEANSFKEFHKHKEEVYWEFNKLGKDLHSKKNKLWEERENLETHAKWKLSFENFKNIDKLLENEDVAKTRMLPKETQFYWDKNNQFKHLQRRSVEEIERCNNVLGDKLEEKFNKIAKEQLKIINK